MRTEKGSELSQQYPTYTKKKVVGEEDDNAKVLPTERHCLREFESRRQRQMRRC